MEPSSQALVAFGAITAAFIAGSFSYLTLVVAKEQKVSEFRQNWIDELRKDICAVVAAVFHLAYRFHNEHGHSATAGLPGELRESHEAYSRGVTSILLRINPHDPDRSLRRANDDLLKSLNAVRHAFNNAQYEEASEACRSLIERAQPVLKDEWTRVKTGEPVYRWSKRVAIAFLLLGMVAGGVTMARPLWISHVGAASQTGPGQAGQVSQSQGNPPAQ
jgi:hypothetical protein